MGKRTNGPDWEAIRIYIGTIERTCQCNVSLFITSDGAGVNPKLRVDVLAAPKRPQSPRATAGVGVGCTYPHREFQTMEGAVYRLLIDLDKVISQAGFPEVPELPF